MNISINEMPIEVEGLTKETTLANLVEAIRKEISSNGLTILKITVDDKIIDPENLEELHKLYCSSYKNINFTVVTPEDMIKIMLDDSSEILDYLSKICEKVANELRIANISEAMQKFVEIVDGLEWLSTLFTNLPIAYPAVENSESFKNSRKSLMNKILEKINFLNSTNQTKDWVSSADILEYEFPELFRECGIFLSKLLSQLQPVANENKG